jgi:hypothetical protein
MPREIIMSETTETVYDSTEIQLQALKESITKRLKPEDLTRPEVVQLILEREIVTLTELKTYKDDNMGLLEQRENLRIELAKSEQREVITWIEVPISFLGGFAINLLTDNLRSGLGWILLVLSISILLILRLPHIASLRRKDSKDGHKKD